MNESILLSSLISIATALVAQAAVPAIRLEGNGTAIEYPLSTHNRIYFNTDHMTIGSSTTAIQPITWAYSTYNTVYITQPQGSATEINAENAKLTYNTGELKLTSEIPETFSCTIYDAKGAAVISGHFDSEGNLTVYDLPAGIYFATATNGAKQHTLKFITR